MRPVRTIATAFLVASLAVAGCGRSAPDQPTSPTVEPPAVTTAVNTQRVRFSLSPTGTDASARLLGEDTNGRDGWALTWQYQDRPLLAHLTVKAVGPGGTSPDTVLGLYHPDPVS